MIPAGVEHFYHLSQPGANSTHRFSRDADRAALPFDLVKVSN
jgi:hypothetical protein